MSAPHLLLVAPAGSYRVGDHLVAADRLGCDVTVVTDAAVAIAGSALVVSLADPQRAAAAVLAACAQPVDAVVGTDGAAVAVAGEIARRCRLPTNSAEALAAAANKLSQRRALAEAGVPQPAFGVAAGAGGAEGADAETPRAPAQVPTTRADARTPAAQIAVRAAPDETPTAQGAVRAAHADTRTPGADARATRATAGATAGTVEPLRELLPAVVKPVDRTASQGVVRADTAVQLREAVARVRGLVGPTAPVLVERFVPGVEIAVDGLLRNGRLQVLAVFDKPDTPTGPTFAETLLISPARLRDDVLRSVIDVVRRAVQAIGLTEGPVHAECKVAGGDVWFVELAARTIGGLCSRSLRVAGMSVEELVLRHALRLPVPPAGTDGATGVLMLPVPAAGRLVAVHGVERARIVPGVTAVVITTGRGAPVTPLPDGDRYLGFVFARTATADACERALRLAWGELTVEVDIEVNSRVGTGARHRERHRAQRQLDSRE